VGVLSAAIAVLGGIGLLVTLEAIDGYALTLAEIPLELCVPTLLVVTAAAVGYRMLRFQRRNEERMTLTRDLEVARSDGARWRSGMRELLRGLGNAIDAQFDRWELTPAEREVALLMLKGLSYEDIAAVRESSEQDVRQQARAILGKANLSGRVALSASSLADLLLAAGERG
jgi:DNA-binding CsgD family transcriptional regulator